MTTTGWYKNTTQKSCRAAGMPGCQILKDHPKELKWIPVYAAGQERKSRQENSAGLPGCPAARFLMISLNLGRILNLVNRMAQKTPLKNHAGIPGAGLPDS